MILAALLLQEALADPCAWTPPGPLRRMEGIFVTEFERPRFYENREAHEVERTTPYALLQRDAAKQAASVGLWRQNHAFRVVIIGSERFPPHGPADPKRPCPPSSGELSHIDATEIVSQNDLGHAADVLPQLGFSSDNQR